MSAIDDYYRLFEWIESHPHVLDEIWNLSDDVTTRTSTNSTASSSSPFPGLENEFPFTESGFYSCNFSDVDDYFDKNQPKLRNSADIQLLVLLDFFRKLYIEKNELFKKTFPKRHGEFAKLFKKIGGPLSQLKLNRSKVRTVQRSLSVGSPRLAPKQGEEESPLRLERFKIKTVDIQLGDPAGQGVSGSNVTNSK